MVSGADTVDIALKTSLVSVLTHGVDNSLGFCCQTKIIRLWRKVYGWQRNILTASLDFSWQGNNVITEPQIPSSARGPSIPELWSLLEAEREPLNTDSPTDSQRQCTFTLLPQKTCTEPMTLEKPAAPVKEEDAIEQFLLLSVVQIDGECRCTHQLFQAAPSSVKDVSPHSITSVTPVPSCVGAGKAVKFILLEEAPQKQSTTSESKDTAGQPMAVNKCPPKDTQSEALPGTVSGTNQFNDHLSENTLKEDGGHVTATSIQTSHRPSEEHQETPSKTLNSLDSPGDLQVAQVTPVEQKLDDGLISTVSVSPAQSVRQVGESVTRLAAFKSSQRSFSLFEPLEDFDPLSSFVMLRTSQRSPVVQKPQQISLHTPEPDSAQRCTRKPIPCSDLLEASKKAKHSEASLRITEKAFSKTIYVQATEAERFAYFELHALAQPSLSRVRESDPNALKRKDFASLTLEDTRFSLKQQERLLSVGQGRDGVYNDVALLHILVRAKEVLLKCDFNTAIGYLEEAQSTCTMGGLKELLRRLQVLQYLNHRNNEEHRPRVLHLQEQTNTYLQRNISNTVLVITATECVRAELVTALSQVPGSSVSAVLPDKDKSKVDSRAVLDRCLFWLWICCTEVQSSVGVQPFNCMCSSLACSRSLVVCSQQVGADFPWQRFTVVLEFDNLCHSTPSSFCSQNNVNYICFCTETPDTDLAVPPQAYLDSVPFLLFISEGLLKSSDLLQLLESKYNMTFLDRSYSQSLQRLGATDVITVDEKTAILLQELEELQLEQASESVVIRLSALSLQFTRCWIILHFNEQHSKLVHGDVFRNLVLIYSSFVLFGLKSEDLEIKVLLVCDVADIAWYVHQICLHTLLSSERSVWSWFDRDWFSVVETEEEKCLVCFPCVNSVVAQLMLRRAPSLQWLLEASFSDLKESFPEFPHKVCKLFSEITALHRLTAAPSLSETEITAPLPCKDMLHPPHPQLPHQAVDGDQPHSDSLTHTQLFLQHSSTEPGSPGLVQQQGIVDRGWYGAVSGASVTPSECVYDSQSWPGEHTQDGRYTAGPFGEGEENWTVDASSLSAPDLSLSHKHPAHFELPAPAVLFSQDAPVEEMKVQQWRSSVCGTSSRGQQSDIYSILSQYQRWIECTPLKPIGPERKRPAREGAGETGFPECKRGKLLFERVPGRCDGQTRLRFF
ncbi:hypothetical protein NFI96_025749 [Prochilodus magdalenae]|nr:hypothetical protein NFI96_025749 [Prochilodus magdalenae]